MLLNTPTPTPMPEVSGDSNFDFFTLLVSVVVGLFSGVVSALITTYTQRKMARASARAIASSALWNFQRTLHDFATEHESQIIDAGSVTLTKTKNEDIAEARAAAYLYRGYLGDRAALVERHWYAEEWPGDDPLTVSRDVGKWSNDLASALKDIFGSDPK